MNPLQLFHFSDEPDIEVFHPRAPLRHPEAEPFVYAIDEAHSPLYLFPRECPRIGTWSESEAMQIFIDASWEQAWRIGHLFRYEFQANGFEDCKDHGVWVKRTTTIPERVTRIDDLPAFSPVTVTVVPSLIETAKSLFDFDTQTFIYPSHVSMIRMSNLADWPGSEGRPTRPS